MDGNSDATRRQRVRIMSERKSKRAPRKRETSEESRAIAVIRRRDATPAAVYRLLTEAEITQLHKQPLETYTTTLAPRTAREVLSILRSRRFRGKTAGSWAYRGQADSTWGLHSSIERSFGGPRVDVVKELTLLRAFKRRAHHYIADLPDDGDELEWLALMQHYGAPTRMLDCTLSPYVATFFAVSGAQHGSAAAVWAFHLPALRGQAYRTFGAEGKALSTVSEPQNFTDLLFSAPIEHRLHPLVCPVEPFRMNERLTIQQGLFFCPRSPQWGLETNLKVALSDAAARTRLKGPHLYKIVIPESARLDLLEELATMNITFATLFPGLEGFARSLGPALYLRIHRARTLNH